MQELRDALSNSVRGARYHWRKTRNMIIHAAGAFENENDNENEMEQQDQNHSNEINEHSTDDNI